MPKARPPRRAAIETLCAATPREALPCTETLRTRCATETLCEATLLQALACQNHEGSDHNCERTGATATDARIAIASGP